MGTTWLSPTLSPYISVMFSAAGIQQVDMELEVWPHSVTQENSSSSSSYWSAEMDREWCNNPMPVHHRNTTLERMESWFKSILSYSHGSKSPTLTEELLCGFKSFPSARQPNAPLSPRVVRLASAPVNFSGGLKTDETGLHSFIFMRREGAPWENIFLQQTQAGLKIKSFQFQKM